MTTLVWFPSTYLVHQAGKAGRTMCGRRYKRNWTRRGSSIDVDCLRCLKALGKES